MLFADPCNPSRWPERGAHKAHPAAALPLPLPTARSGGPFVVRDGTVERAPAPAAAATGAALAAAAGAEPSPQPSPSKKRKKKKGAAATERGEDGQLAGEVKQEEVKEEPGEAEAGLHAAPGPVPRMLLLKAQPLASTGSGSKGERKRKAAAAAGGGGEEEDAEWAAAAAAAAAGEGSEGGSGGAGGSEGAAAPRPGRRASRKRTTAEAVEALRQLGQMGAGGEGEEAEAEPEEGQDSEDEREQERAAAKVSGARTAPISLAAWCCAALHTRVQQQGWALRLGDSSRRRQEHGTGGRGRMSRRQRACGGGAAHAP